MRSDDEQIDCGARCQSTPPQGATVRLTAKPDPGYYFSNWTGPCSGEAPTCTFTASGPTTTVGAVFRKSKIEQQQGRLALKESINFESGKSVILAGSFGLLDEAVLILRQLLRSDDEKVRRDAARALLDLRFKLLAPPDTSDAVTSPRSADARRLVAFLEAHSDEEITQLAAEMHAPEAAPVALGEGVELHLRPE